MIASGATVMQVANQVGQQDRDDQEHLRHLFAQDRALILKAINHAVSRLYVRENTDEDAA